MTEATGAGKLAGAGLLITRPEEQAQALARAVTAAGGRACCFPVMEIEPLAETGPARQRLAWLREQDWLVVVSPSAARQLLRLVEAEGMDLSGIRLAAVGAGTARALEAAGYPVQARPLRGQGLAALMASPAFQDLAGRRVLICRGEGGRRLLDETLAEQGVAHDELVLYRRSLPRVDTEPLLRWLNEDRIDIVVLTSVTAVKHLLQLLPESHHPLVMDKAVVAPSGRVLKQAAKQGFLGPLLRAPEAGDESIVRTAVDWWQRNR